LFITFLFFLIDSTPKRAAWQCGCLYRCLYLFHVWWLSLLRLVLVLVLVLL